MATLDHIIVKVNDLDASVVFYTDVLGFTLDGKDGPFTVVRVGPDFQLQLAPWGTPGFEHYAFSVSRDEFDRIFARIQAMGIAYGPSFDSVGSNTGPGAEVGARGAAPTVYFNDPNRHLLEIRSYERRVCCRAVNVKPSGAAMPTTKTGTTAAAKKTVAPATESAAELIDAKIVELGDWRGAMLAHLRALIQQADPEVVEEVKWRGVPCWSHAGLICTGETYKSVVKMTFDKGASVADPSGLFNSSLDGNVRRAIDFHEGDMVNEPALKALVRAAVALNLSTVRR